MGTYHLIYPVVGVSLAGVVKTIVKDNKHLLVFEGIEYPRFINNYSTEFSECEEEKPALQKALEKSYAGLAVFYREDYIDAGFVGIRIGKKKDMGEVEVYSDATQEEINDAFSRVQEALGVWPTLHLVHLTC